MLYLLGSLKIEVVPFNVHEADESGQTDYAIKPVAGAERGRFLTYSIPLTIEVAI